MKNTKLVFQTDFHLFLAINTLNQHKYFYSNYIFDIKPIWNSKIAFILLKPLLTIVLKTRGGWSVKSPYINCGATAVLFQQLEDCGTWDNSISALKAQAQCAERSSIFFFFFNIYLFIWLRWVLVSCSMWDPVPWPGTEPGSPALGAWSLSHWTTR